MVEVKYNIFQIDPNNLLRLDVVSDENLKSYLEEVTIPSTFIPNEDFIQLSYYTLDNTKLVSINNYTNYSILSGDSITSVKGNSEIGIDPLEDYKLYYNDNSEVKSLYHFLRNPFRVQDTNSTFSVESISPDRRELRLIPISLESITVGQLTNRLEERLENSTYNLDIHLYSSNDEFYPIVNIGSREFRGTTAVVVKLAEPLESSVKIYSTFTVVEKVSNSLAFEVNTTLLEEEPFIPTLRGANFNVGVGEQTTEPSEYFNYNELFSFPSGNSNRELNSLFNEKGAELGIDYSDFSNFVNFSSIEERLRNFKYKVELLESYQSNLDIINTTGVTYNSSGISGSRDYYENLLDGVVNNFDHYERSLYYESGSNSWPKSNNEKPYTNEQANSTEAISWYSAKLQEATLFDAQNVNILTNTIPSYLKEDESNDPYNLFINMIGQHFDNLWTYTDAVSKKYDADNRINRGVSKDLVEELLKNFGLKLYTSNKSAEDLFKYFIANSYDNNDEYLPSGIITSGEQTLSQNDYQKEIYKRIYHNLPILLKSKGTERGLRALINCFGIPSDILKIKIYGGQSVEELPFFAGEQAWTGSVDKVRLDNTGSIVEGSTLSYYTGISRSDSKYTQDLHRIEVGFSPSDNMDSYIVSQSAFLFPNDPFNIDDYIGDPRGYESNIYPNLYKYSKIIFENVDAYDLKDFVRLIKFFDNVVFRMVKDFVPARTVTDSGIIIKPHLLEKYHAKSPVMTWTRPEYSGSIDTAFISGSNAGAYKNVGSGSVGNLLSRESSTRSSNVIQSPLGKVNRADKLHEEPKLNGELYESYIKITDGELNKANPFKNLEYPIVKYGIVIHADPPPNTCLLGTDPLPTYPLNPDSVNSNNQLIAENFNLSNLFEEASAIIDYTVIQNNITTDVVGFNVYYNFLENGYSQYDTITVDAEHEGISGCENTREVILVKCDLVYTGGNLPQILVPDQPFNFEEAIYTGANTQLEYILGGIVINNPSNHAINHDDYSNASTITLAVRDINDPLGCIVTVDFTFSNCILTSITPRPQLTEGNPPRIKFPYTFTGFNPETTFQFRILWDSRPAFLNNPLPLFEANRFSAWIEIQNTAVPATSLSEIINTPGFEGANIIATHTDPDLSSYESSFTGIANFIETQLYSQYHAFRVQFKAANPGGCTTISENLYILGADAPPQPEYHLVTDAHFTTTSTNPVNSICCMNNQVDVYLEGYYSLEECYDDPNYNGVPKSLIWTAPPTPGQGNNSGTLAPKGHYSTGFKHAHWWLGASGDAGYWGDIVDCSNVNSEQCS
jgi:hypothetical protein